MVLVFCAAVRAVVALRLTQSAGYRLGTQTMKPNFTCDKDGCNYTVPLKVSVRTAEQQCKTEDNSGVEGGCSSVGFGLSFTSVIRTSEKEART
jgi:hypothetical protein